jgi:hypothetical protein
MYRENVFVLTTFAEIRKNEVEIIFYQNKIYLYFENILNEKKSHIKADRP